VEKARHPRGSQTGHAEAAVRLPEYTGTAAAGAQDPHRSAFPELARHTAGTKDGATAGRVLHDQRGLTARTRDRHRWAQTGRGVLHMQRFLRVSVGGDPRRALRNHASAGGTAEETTRTGNTDTNHPGTAVGLPQHTGPGTAGAVDPDPGAFAVLPRQTA